MDMPIWKHTLDYVVWNDATMSSPKQNGEYLCKVGLVEGYNGEKAVINSYVYEILMFNDKWETEYQDELVVAWTSIPQCDIE